jgi:LEA14-like dessication related protein
MRGAAAASPLTLDRAMNNPRWISIAAILALVSCSTMPREYEVLRVHIADLTAKDVAIFEQRFDVKLRIQNPNDSDFIIKGLRFDMDLNDRSFASGMSGQRLTVPRFGSEIVDVEVFTTLASFLRQIRELSGGTAERVRYRLKGTAFVESPGSFRAPFDEQGEINLGVEEKTER